jgi:hypothetical protein
MKTKGRYSAPFCLSRSKRTEQDWDIIESHSMVWNSNYATTIFRIIREYDQMKKWAMYNMRGTSR